MSLTWDISTILSYLSPFSHSLLYYIDFLNFRQEWKFDIAILNFLFHLFQIRILLLFLSEMYSKFIEANREEDSNERLKTLRHLVSPNFSAQPVPFSLIRLFAYFVTTYTLSTRSSKFKHSDTQYYWLRRMF